MDSPSTEKGRLKHEWPLHEVEITQPFYLGVFPVTQAQDQRVMRSNPSWFCATGSGRNPVVGMDTSAFPVERVNWEDASAFLKRLSGLAEEKKHGRKYRLPTEAEWEYACRGGTASSTAFAFGNRLSSTQANCNGKYPVGGGKPAKSLERTCSVGSYALNAFGLYDMHGNVYEWCADRFESGYARGPVKDPLGPTEGSGRVFRGGCWCYNGSWCRLADRAWSFPVSRDMSVGFRVAMVVSDQESVVRK
jgi:formylglycine-generating enzyme required for sulfatase activity